MSDHSSCIRLPSISLFQKSCRPSAVDACFFSKISRSLNIFGSNLSRQTSRRDCRHWYAFSKRASPCELFTSSRINVAICRHTSGNDGVPCSIKNLKSSIGVNVPTVRIAAFFFAAAWASNEVESFGVDVESPVGSSSFSFSSRRAFFATLNRREIPLMVREEAFSSSYLSELPKRASPVVIFCRRSVSRRTNFSWICSRTRFPFAVSDCIRVSFISKMVLDSERGSSGAMARRAID